TVAGPTWSTPGRSPATKSVATRSTSALTMRAMRRSGMYSANGTGWRLAYWPVTLACGSHTRPAFSTPVSGPSSAAPPRIGAGGHRGDEDRGGDRAGGGVDRQGRVGVAQRVDVAGVLRPDHQVWVWGLTAPDLVGQLDGGLDVVVQHGAALLVEVKAKAGDV